MFSAKIEEKILLDFQKKKNKTKRGKTTKLDALVNILLRKENKSDQII